MVNTLEAIVGLGNVYNKKDDALPETVSQLNYAFSSKKDDHAHGRRPSGRERA